MILNMNLDLRYYNKMHAHVIYEEREGEREREREKEIKREREGQRKRGSYFSMFMF